MSLTSLSSIYGLFKFQDLSGGQPGGGQPSVKTWSQLSSDVNTLRINDIILYNNTYFTCIDNTSYRASYLNPSNNVVTAGDNVTGFTYVVIANPSNNKIYYGGTFTAIGNSGPQTYGGVAVYDYVNNIISPVLSDAPSIPSPDVRALCFDNSNNFYFAGKSNTLNSSTSSEAVYKFDGTTTSFVGTNGPSGNYVHAMAYDPLNNELYAGGNFSSKLMKWNGTTWSTVYYTGTTQLNSQIKVLHFYNTKLYVGGLFTNIGNYVAIYDTINNTWIQLGNGVSGPCYSITISPYTGVIYMSAQIDSNNTRIYKYKNGITTNPEEISLSFFSANSAYNLLKILVTNNQDDLLVGSRHNTYDGVIPRLFVYN